MDRDDKVVMTPNLSTLFLASAFALAQDPPQDWMAIGKNEQACRFVYRAYTIRTAGPARFRVEAPTTPGISDSLNFALFHAEPNDCAGKCVHNFAQGRDQFLEVHPHFSQNFRIPLITHYFV
jgi:hypothetical protein